MDTQLIGESDGEFPMPPLANSDDDWDFGGANVTLESDDESDDDMLPTGIPTPVRRPPGMSKAHNFAK